MTTPLLFIHGFLGHPDDWKACQSYLNYDGPIHNICLPGHLSLDAPPLEDGFNYVATYIKEYSERHRLGPCDVVAYSLGGRVALHTAFKYPNLFKSLIVLAASPGIHCSTEKQARLAWDKIKIKQIKSKALIQFLDEDWYSLSLFKEFRACPAYEEAFTQRCSHNPVSIAQTMLALSPVMQSSLWAKLDYLPLHFTYIYGLLDSKHADIGKKIKNLNPQSKIVGVPDCGHVIHIEKPAILADILRQTLQC